MKLSDFKQKLKFLVWGIIITIVLMFLELRYCLKEMDFSQNSISILLLFLFQILFFTIAFFMAEMFHRCYQNWKQGKLQLGRADKLGAVLVIISIILFFTLWSSFPSDSSPLLSNATLLAGILLLLIGVIQYRKTRNEQSIILISWGITVNLLLYITTFIMG